MANKMSENNQTLLIFVSAIIAVIAIVGPLVVADKFLDLHYGTTCQPIEVLEYGKDS